MTKLVLIQSVVIEPPLVQQAASIPLQRFTINTTTCLLRQETSRLRNLLGQNLWNEEPRRLQVEGYWEQRSVGVALSMVKIQPGTSLLGSPEGESMRLPEEAPSTK